MSKILFTLTTKVFGLKNIPKDKAFILVSNHGSALDPLIIVCALYQFIKHLLLLDKKFYWIGNIRLRERFYLKFLQKDTGYLASKKTVILTSLRLLKKENPIGIFPEGIKLNGGELGGAKNGAAYMTLLSGACVVPTACSCPSVKSFFKALIVIFLPKKVVFGKPIYFPKIKSSDIKKNQKMVEEITGKIIKEINKLLKGE